MGLLFAGTTLITASGLILPHNQTVKVKRRGNTAQCHRIKLNKGRIGSRVIAATGLSEDTWLVGVTHCDV